MEVLLLQDIPGIGKKDDLLIVKEGYALNNLLPYRKALVATPTVRKRYADQIRGRAGSGPGLPDARRLAAHRDVTARRRRGGLGARRRTSGRVHVRGPVRLRAVVERARGRRPGQRG